MNVVKVGTRKRLKKGNRERKKPLHERPKGDAVYEDIDELFFGDTPFDFTGAEE